MRTKHIFSTLAVAAFAVACSNEELELVNNSNELAQGRYEIGQVELSLGEGVESRYAVGPNFNDLTAEAGDELGAALIDTWNGTKDANDYKYDYTIADYIQTNYSFKYDGTTWASEAKMVEGNYFFYAPYNANHVTRASVTAKFNAVQQLALNADGTIDALSTIKELKESGEVMAVGYKFISRVDGKTVNASLLPIYAYPVVTLKNSYEPVVDGKEVPTDLVINQVVITKDGGFPTEATFKFAEADKTAISAAKGLVGEFKNFTYWDRASESNKAAKGGFAKNNGYEDNYTAELLNEASKTSSAIVVKAPANYVLKAGETTKFHVVMPAASYKDLFITVYTNKGVFDVTAEGLDLAIAAGKRYGQNDYKADGTLKNDAEMPSGETLSLNIATEATAPANIVTSSADLVSLIQNTKDDELTAQPLNDDVEINAAVMNAIKAKASGFELTVSAPATIATNLNSSNKTIVFAEGAIVKEGTITINNNVEFAGNLNVKGGIATIAAVFNEAALEVNGGEVTLNSDVATTVNKGKLTIGKTTFANNVINNGGEITFVAGTSSAAKSYTFSKTVANYKGTMTVPAYTTLNEVTYNGKADVVATLNVNGKVTTVVENRAKGTLNIAGQAEVTTNKGLVVMGSSNAKVKVTTNEYRINNTNNGTVEIPTNGTEGVIYYEFTENVNGKLVAKASKYNTIILNGMTWAPEAEQTISADVIMKDATIEIWDAAAEITISGSLTAENSANKYSYIKGVENASVEVEGDYTADDTKIKVTGVTVE